uniref:Uncharacterized protein n=1 Tax=Ralstonia syzygii R24 TaxID=907261 RepID=G3A1S4_9RALS|nr:hypothetical protein RALSY_11192 [Ralstonia syzygii R24]
MAPPPPYQKHRSHSNSACLSRKFGYDGRRSSPVPACLSVYRAF